MSAQHTPGPWSISTFSPRSIVKLYPEDRVSICVVSGVRDGCQFDGTDRLRDKRQQANALLIAAAPDLLESLRGLYAAMACYESTPEETLALEYARAAIAKATGGTA